MSKKTKKDTRKLIDLPPTTVKKLDKMAANVRMKTKPYMETILIIHADKRD
jgi:hypothetical protein